MWLWFLMCKFQTQLPYCYGYGYIFSIEHDWSLYYLGMNECHGISLLARQHWFSSWLGAPGNKPYLNQCWPRSPMQYGIIRPQWVKHQYLNSDRYHFYISRQEQNGHHAADKIFKLIFSNENVQILIKISMKFVRKGLVNNESVLVQVMAWHRPGTAASGTQNPCKKIIAK